MAEKANGDVWITLSGKGADASFVTVSMASARLEVSPVP